MSASENFTTLRLHIASGTCDFEGPSTCGWSTNHEGVWKKMAGAQDYYGPGYDHSLGTGEGSSYIFISTSPVLPALIFNLITYQNKRV